MSKYPSVDLPLFLTGFINEIDFTEICGTEKVNFHFGDQDELDRYLNLFKNSSSEKLAQSIMVNGSYDLAISNGDITMPYPIIWLKLVKNGNPRTRNKDRRGICQLIENIEILFICDTDCEWLNTERWEKNMSKLRQLACKFQDSFRGKQWAIMIDENSYEIGDFSKKADCEKHWDAFILNFDLLLNAKCLSEKKYKFCNT